MVGVLKTLRRVAAFDGFRQYPVAEFARAAGFKSLSAQDIKNSFSPAFWPV
jgi:hypothetical protein